jgi:hypothetical protein
MVALLQKYRTHVEKIKVQKIKIINKMSQQLINQLDLGNDNSLIKKEDFTSDKIGRGVWHSWHTIGFKARNRYDILLLYEFILLFVINMHCMVCSKHADQYIKENNILHILMDNSLTDTEIINIFNEWLYNFHKTANTHAGKISPSYEEVIKFYMSLERCEDDCAK